MRVLVGCEESGVVRRAFRGLGHDAWSCDLMPARDGSPYHFQCDLLDILDQDWDLGIFHPPCTYISVSGIHWNNRGRGWQKTEQAVEFFIKLAHSPIHHVCLENPVSIISTRWRKPDQIIQPYEFGHDASKKTCLWLKNLPKLTPTNIVPGRLVNNKMRWANQTDSGQNRLGPSEERARIRSRTYEGIAQAMAEQWSEYVLNFKGMEAKCER